MPAIGLMRMGRSFGSSRRIEPSSPVRLDPHAQMKIRLQSMDAARVSLVRQMSAVEREVLKAQEGADMFSVHVQTMLEDFRVLEHHPSWRAAILAVAEFAGRESVAALREETTRDAASMTVMPLASEILTQLQAGEPSIQPHAAILLILDEKARGALQVPPARAQSKQRVAAHDRDRDVARGHRMVATRGRVRALCYACSTTRHHLALWRLTAARDARRALAPHRRWSPRLRLPPARSRAQRWVRCGSRRLRTSSRWRRSLRSRAVAPGSTRRTAPTPPPSPSPPSRNGMAARSGSSSLGHPRCVRGRA